MLAVWFGDESVGRFPALLGTTGLIKRDLAILGAAFPLTSLGAVFEEVSAFLLPHPSPGFHNSKICMACVI